MPCTIISSPARASRHQHRPWKLARQRNKSRGDCERERECRDYVGGSPIAGYQSRRPVSKPKVITSRCVVMFESRDLMLIQRSNSNSTFSFHAELVFGLLRWASTPRTCKGFGSACSSPVRIFSVVSQYSLRPT